MKLGNSKRHLPCTKGEFMPSEAAALAALRTVLGITSKNIDREV